MNEIMNFVTLYFLIEKAELNMLEHILILILICNHEISLSSSLFFQILIMILIFNCQIFSLFSQELILISICSYQTFSFLFQVLLSTVLHYAWVLILILILICSDQILFFFSDFVKCSSLLCSSISSDFDIQWLHLNIYCCMRYHS